MAALRHPNELVSIREVIEYWQNCLQGLSLGERESIVASHMVGVVSNRLDEEWSDGYPEYAEIFERAATLELPTEMFPNAAERQKNWREIYKYLDLLRQRAGMTDS